MNELGNIGFTYDIKTFTPDGEKKDDFSVHNLIPNEGLQWFVQKLFFNEENFNQTTTKNKDFSNFYLSFMTAAHTPSPFDTFFTFIPVSGEANLGTNNLYETRFDENTDITTLTGQNNRFYRYWNSTNGLNTATNTLTFLNYKWGSQLAYYDKNMFIVCCKTPVLLTGVFLTADSVNWPQNFGNINSRLNSPAILLSEAMFPEPILLEVWGKMQVNIGFTVISA